MSQSKCAEILIKMTNSIFRCDDINGNICGLYCFDDRIRNKKAASSTRQQLSLRHGMAVYPPNTLFDSVCIIVTVCFASLHLSKNVSYSQPSSVALYNNLCSDSVSVFLFESANNCQKICVSFEFKMTDSNDQNHFID
eukprot:953501_1